MDREIRHEHGIAIYHYANGVEIHYDDGVDVLHARRMGTGPLLGMEAPHDVNLILKHSEDGVASGMTWIGALARGFEAWISHPDRSLLPFDILKAVDDWLSGQRK